MFLWGAFYCLSHLLGPSHFSEPGAFPWCLGISLTCHAKTQGRHSKVSHGVKTAIAGGIAQVGALDGWGPLIAFIETVLGQPLAKESPCPSYSC